MTEVHGRADPRFVRLKDALAASLADGSEMGVRVAVALDGEVVADLWGGVADRTGARPMAEDTLVPVFSTGKAVQAILIARLVEQGRLDYEQRVSEVWPTFGQPGKERITVGQLLSHQAGLPGIGRDLDPEWWYDLPGVLAELERLAPMWPPGEASGYHPITIGFLAGEVHRRVDGRTLGEALRTYLAEPFGLNLWWGLPESEHDRVAELKKPSAPADLGPLDDVKRAAFYRRGATPGGRAASAWRAAEFPAANLHADAPSLARMLSVCVDGRLDGRHVLSSGTLAQLTRERIYGQDRVLPFRVSWGAGVMRNKGLKVFGPNDEAVGHAGSGGSCAFADPARRLAFAYTPNRQQPYLVGDPRSLKLIEAVYAAL